MLVREKFHVIQISLVCFTAFSGKCPHKHDSFSAQLLLTPQDHHESIVIVLGEGTEGRLDYRRTERNRWRQQIAAKNYNEGAHMLSLAALTATPKMGLVGSCILSVTDGERVCKFCYGEDDQGGRWLRPCMCSGSLKWVHLSCFDRWMEKAPAQQQIQCQTCRYVYVKTWVLKPFSDWCRPAIKLSAWECIEIFLDTYSTYKFLRGFLLMLDGQRSIVVQCLHFLFWRVFIATDRRLAYYTSLGRQLLSSIFEISVKDFVSEKEGSSELSTPFGSSTSVNM